MKNMHKMQRDPRLPFDMFVSVIRHVMGREDMAQTFRLVEYLAVIWLDTEPWAEAFGDTPDEAVTNVIRYYQEWKKSERSGEGN